MTKTKSREEIMRQAVGEYTIPQIIEEFVKLKLGASATKAQVAVQTSSGNWDFDPYMQGMANGLILAMANLTGEEPQFLDAPKRWLNNKHNLERKFAVLDSRHKHETTTELKRHNMGVRYVRNILEGED